MEDLTWVRLDKIFTEAQIQQMTDLMQENDSVTRIHDEVIVPNLQHINTVTGQENDPMYWAYVSVYALDSVFNPDAPTMGGQAQ